MTQSQSFRWRLGAAACSDLALLLVFIPALASAHSPNGFSGIAYPWQDVRRDILIFIFATVAVVAAIPILVRGSIVQRIFSVVLLFVPASAVIMFVLWSLKQI